MPATFRPASLFPTPKRGSASRSPSAIELLEARIAPATLYVGQASAFTIDDDVAPADLSDGDTVTWQSTGSGHGSPVAGLIYGTTAFGTIQSAVAAATATIGVQDAIRVADGTYDEDVNLNEAGLRLLGAGSALSTIRGAIGGPSTTVQLSASNLEVAGFAITRLGNNTTDWNNPGLNNAGLAVQGLSITGAEVHDNLFIDNRTAIDVNNSGGHAFHNNLIVDNRVGMIFRSQTEDVTVTENVIRDSFVVGILFLDASAGTNSPVQGAANSVFSNNSITGNWYAGIVDRQAGGALPAPGMNLKDFRGNWFGTASPVLTTANSTEPGYAAQIPVKFGGTATAPGGQPDIAGPASGNFLLSPLLDSGTDTSAEFGFQGNLSVLVVSKVSLADMAASIQHAVDFASAGARITVPAGTYAEFVTVNKAITLAGAQADKNALTRPVGVPETILNGPGGSLLLTGSNAVIDGFTIQGATQSSPIGAAISTDGGGSGYIIRNNIIRDNTIGLNLNSSGASQTIIEQNVFLDNNQMGDSGGTGLYSDSNLVDAVIRNNRFAGDHFTAAILLQKGGSLSDVVIIGNEVSGGSQMRLLGSSNSTVDGNTFAGATLAATALVAGGGNRDLTLSNNTFTDRAGGAILAGDLELGFGPNSDLSITGNTIFQDVGLLPSSRAMIRLIGVEGDSGISSNVLTLRGTMVAAEFVHGIGVEGAGTGNIGIGGNMLAGGQTDVFGGMENNTGVQLRDSLPVTAQIAIDSNTFTGWAIPSENRETHAIVLGPTDFGPGATTLRASSLSFTGPADSITGGGVLTIQPFDAMATLGLNGAAGGLLLNHQTLLALNGTGANRLTGLVFAAAEVAVATDSAILFTPALTLSGTSKVIITGSMALRGNGAISLSGAQVNLGTDLVSGGAITIASPQLTLMADVTLNSTAASAAGANVTITGRIDSDALAPRALIVFAGSSGTAIFGDSTGTVAASIGGTAPLGSLSVTAGTTRLFSASLKAGSGGVTFNGPVQVHSALTIQSAQGIAFTSTLDGTASGAGNLTLIAPGMVSFGGAIGGQSSLGGLAASGASAISIGGDVASTGAVNLSAVNLALGAGHSRLTANALSLASGTPLILKSLAVENAITLGAPEIDFTGGADSVEGGSIHLRPGSDTQAINLGAAIDVGTASLDLTAADLAALKAGFTRTIGSPTGTGKITLAKGTAFADPVAIQSPGVGGSIELAAGRKPLTASGGITLDSPSTLLRTGIVTDHGDITVTGAVLFANTTLDSTVGSRAGAGDISITSASTNLPAKHHALVLKAGAGDIKLGGTVTNLGAITANSAGQTLLTGTVSANSIKTDAPGTTRLDGAVTTKTAAGQRYLDPVLIGGSVVTLTSTTGNGPIAFAKTVNALDATPHVLSIVSGSKPLVFAEGLGDAQPLSALSIEARGKVTNAGADAWHVTGPTSIQVSASKSIALKAPGNTFGTLVLSGRNAAVTEAGGIDLGGAILRGTLSLLSTGNAEVTQSGPIDVAVLRATSGGAIVFDTATNRIRQVGPLRAAGAIVLVAGQSNLLLTGDITTTLTTVGDNVVIAANTGATTFNLSAAKGVEIDAGGGRFLLYTHQLSASKRLTTLTGSTEVGVLYPATGTAVGDAIFYAVV